MYDAQNKSCFHTDINQLVLEAAINYCEFITGGQVEHRTEVTKRSQVIEISEMSGQNHRYLEILYIFGFILKYYTRFVTYMDIYIAPFYFASSLKNTI